MNYYIKKHGINDVFSTDMSSYMELFIFKKNDYICKEAEEVKYVYFFVDGKAKVYTTLSNGKSLLLCFYQNFRVLGDIELVGNEFAQSNVQAIDDVYCIGISYEKAKKYLLDDPKFLRFVCNSLGVKLNRCSKNGSINMLYPLDSRLASYMLVVGQNTKSENKERIIFNENLTEIAELLGTSYRHLLRTLNRFLEKGYVKKINNQYEVVNLKELTQIAADLYK
jgi:CRP/FNR family transcriptional regulator, putaive post-exponential-phase nitrogen-starvation regulator